MAKLDFYDYINDYSNGEVELIMVEFSNQEDEVGAFYEYKMENGKMLVKIDMKIFENADKKVLEALIDNLSPEQKTREKAETVLGEFTRRTGKYQKLGEKESREELKEIIKDLEGKHLKELLLIAQEIQSEVIQEVSEVDLQETVNL